MENNTELLSLENMDNLLTRNYIIRIIIQIASFCCYLATGFILVFFISRLMPGSPFTHPHEYNDEQIINLIQEYRLNEPYITQFFHYLSRVFIFDWGVSLATRPGQPVWQLLWEKLPRSMEITFLAFLFALPIGILFGTLRSDIFSKPKFKKLINILFIGYIGLITLTGVIFITIALKSILTPRFFPMQGYVTMAYSGIIKDHYTVTGFGLIDTLLNFQFGLWFDILKHIFLPACILSAFFLIPVAMLTTRIFNSIMPSEFKVLKNKGPKTCSYLFMTLFGGMIVTVIGVIEYTFNIYGAFQLFFDALTNRDYFLIQGICHAFLLIFLGIPMIINIVNILSDHFKNASTTIKLDSNEPFLDKNRITLGINDEKFLPVNLFFKRWILNPYIIIGFVGFLLMIVLTVLGPIKFDKFYLIDNLQPNPWSEPSPDHLLGTCHYGYDVLGRLLYGFQPVMILFVGLVVSGAIGYGLGFLMRIKNNIIQDILKMVVNSFLFFPLFILILLYQGISEVNSVIYLIIYGFFIMIRVGMHLAESGDDSLSFGNRFSKSIPNALLYLFGAIFVMHSLHLALSYVGYGGDGIITWGADLSANRSRFKANPWIMWFGMGTVLLNFTLIMFSIGTYVSKYPSFRHLKQNQIANEQ